MAIPVHPFDLTSNASNKMGHYESCTLIHCINTLLKHCVLMERMVWREPFYTTEYLVSLFNAFCHRHHFCVALHNVLIPIVIAIYAVGQCFLFFGKVNKGLYIL